MIESRAPSHRQIRDIWRSLCRMQGAAPDIGENCPWAEHWWKPDREPFWRWNADEKRASLSEEVQHLRHFVERAEKYAKKVVEGAKIGAELLKYLDGFFKVCSSCKGEGGERERGYGWVDCAICGGWGCELKKRHNGIDGSRIAVSPEKQTGYRGQ